MTKSLALLVAAGLALAACSQVQLDRFQAGIEKVNIFATKYGPILGRDLIMVSNIIVQAECSPALGAVTTSGSKVLKLLAPNSSSAVKVTSALNTNFSIAQELCPLVASIEASVGKVPDGTPSQIVPTPAVFK